MLLRDLIAHAESKFSAAGIDTPLNDAEILAAHFLGISWGELQTRLILDDEITEEQAYPIITAYARRMQREPLQHITAIAYFRSLELRVGLGVFVPRPETEMVAGLAIAELQSFANENPIAIDLGSGSGAIALSLQQEVPNSRVYAVEKSPAAFEFTSKNFERYGNPENLVLADMADAFPELNGNVAVVVSNPPYIPVAAVPRDLEVAKFDPALALYGGEDGLDVIRVVSKTANRLLRTGGFLVIEHSDEQSDAVVELLLADGWNDVTAHQDLTQRDRAVSARK
ncbi:MAG: hypothetical protein RIR16_537 [Actinomycetota bacterium]|jgi:release factor glutamine methyltransferase